MKVKRFVVAAAVGAALLAASGCSALNYAEMAVDGYCGLSTEMRQANRAAVAAAVAPHRIQIECAE